MELSSKEKTLIEDLLSAEQLLNVKYQAYSSQANDPQICTLFDQMFSSQQKHTTQLQNLLSEGGYVNTEQ